MVLKRLLDHAKRAVGIGHTLDRPDLGALDLGREHRAGFHRRAVYMNDASAALAGVAADMGAGQSQPLPQEVDQKCTAFDLAGNGFAVNGH